MDLDDPTNPSRWLMRLRLIGAVLLWAECYQLASLCNDPRRSRKQPQTSILQGKNLFVLCVVFESRVGLAKVAADCRT